MSFESTPYYFPARHQLGCYSCGAWRMARHVEHTCCN